MPHVKRYIDTDVLTEAKKRVHHIYDVFDSVVVAFSGGKDSLAVLHLCKEVLEERGDRGPVHAYFLDEEVIPNVVIAFVESYLHQPWLDLKYFAVPLKSSAFVLGKLVPYVQWDPDREHIRPRPAHAIAYDDRRVFDEHSFHDHIATLYPGKIAICSGIRAAESLRRFSGSVRKLNENYITDFASGTLKNAKSVKPIFDWEENDVFRYFYDRGIAYCAAYDAQVFAGKALRITTPLPPEQARNFDLLRAVDPELYERVIAVFPRMLLQERYYKEMHAQELRDLKNYEAEGLAGVERFIRETIRDPQQRKLALIVLRNARQNPNHFPVRKLLLAMASGEYRRKNLIPQSRSKP